MTAIALVTVVATWTDPVSSAPVMVPVVPAEESDATPGAKVRTAPVAEPPAEQVVYVDERGRPLRGDWREREAEAEDDDDDEHEGRGDHDERRGDDNDDDEHEGRGDDDHDD
jgi:hypothetical protein